jgi:hypothetical protein
MSKTFTVIPFMSNIKCVTHYGNAVDPLNISGAMLYSNIRFALQIVSQIEINLIWSFLCH